MSDRDIQQQGGGRQGASKTSSRSSEVAAAPTVPLYPQKRYLADVAFLEDVAKKAQVSPLEAQEYRALDRKLRNCCGQYALATVLESYGIKVSLHELIQRTNPVGIFTGPREMIDVLKSARIPSQSCNRSSGQDLYNHVSSGRPAILLVDANIGDGLASPHWIVVGKPMKNNQGKVVSWEVSDAANMTDSPTFVGQLSHEALMKSWEQPLGKAGTLLVSNYFIAVGQAPEKFKIPTPSTLAFFSADVVGRAAELPYRVTWKHRTPPRDEGIRIGSAQTFLLPEAAVRR